MNRLAFRVVGHPQPAGSKRAFPIKRKTGGMGVSVTDANPKAKPWQAAVASAADDAMTLALAGELDDPAPASFFHGPLGLSCIFTLARPKGHYRTGRYASSLRPRAPEWPVVKPDCTKLLRAVEDALTGVVWRDDAQVVEQAVSKRYGAPEGVSVVVWKL
jgi:Holliday junction resolvase RusA-like endonuclease